MTGQAHTPTLLSFAVPGVGEFEARKRTFGDEAKVELATRQMLGGAKLADDDDLRWYCRVFCTLRVLLVTKPDGWDLDDLDPLDPDDIGSALSVFGGLRAAEDDFRKRARALRPVLGAGA